MSAVKHRGTAGKGRWKPEPSLLSARVHEQRNLTGKISLSEHNKVLLCCYEQAYRCCVAILTSVPSVPEASGWLPVLVLEQVNCCSWVRSDSIFIWIILMREFVWKWGGKKILILLEVFLSCGSLSVFPQPAILPLTVDMLLRHLCLFPDLLCHEKFTNISPLLQPHLH